MKENEEKYVKRFIFEDIVLISLAVGIYLTRLLNFYLVLGFFLVFILFRKIMISSNKLHNESRTMTSIDALVLFAIPEFVNFFLRQSLSIELNYRLDIILVINIFVGIILVLFFRKYREVFSKLKIIPFLSFYIISASLWSTPLHVVIFLFMFPIVYLKEKPIYFVINDHKLRSNGIALFVSLLYLSSTYVTSCTPYRDLQNSYIGKTVVLSKNYRIKDYSKKQNGAYQSEIHQFLYLNELTDEQIARGSKADLMLGDKLYVERYYQRIGDLGLVLTNNGYCILSSPKFSKLIKERCNLLDFDSSLIRPEIEFSPNFTDWIF